MTTGSGSESHFARAGRSSHADSVISRRSSRDALVVEEDRVELLVLTVAERVGEEPPLHALGEAIGENRPAEPASAGGSVA